MEKVDLRKELSEAKRIAVSAWEIIEEYYDNNVDVEKNKDGTPVTLADKKSNEYIMNELLDRFPNYGLVSEENTDRTSKERTWYIDPIDGTKGFIKRNAHCAVHIGLSYAGKAKLGVIYWGPTRNMYTGIVGEGAWRENGIGKKELRVEKNKDLGLVAITNGDRAHRDLEKFFEKMDVREVHNSGGEGLRLLKICENRADIRVPEGVFSSNTWDICAPQAIVEAAGGFFKLADGREITYNGQCRIGERYIVLRNYKLMKKAISLYKEFVN